MWRHGCTLADRLCKKNSLSHCSLSPAAAQTSSLTSIVKVQCSKTRQGSPIFQEQALALCRSQYSRLCGRTARICTSPVHTRVQCPQTGTVLATRSQCERILPIAPRANSVVRRSTVHTILAHVLALLKARRRSAPGLSPLVPRALGAKERNPKGDTMTWRATLI